jgi:hypothetical protein
VLDTDTDGDLAADVAEGFDPDVAALGADGDGDGLDDAWDPDRGGIAAHLPDADGDGLADWRDDDDCLAGLIPPVAVVRAVKAGAGLLDVALSWTPAAGADAYNVWVVSGDAAASNKAGIPAARQLGPWPSVAGCLQQPSTACSDGGAVAGTAGDIRFYQVRGACGATEAAE